MKAKQHTLIVLLAFVLAAGAALALLTHANQKAEQAASEAEDGSIPLLDVTTATLESVSIQYGGDTLTLRPSDDGWTLTEDPAYHLDDSACNTIRTALAGMKARRQLKAQPGEDYGFDAPRLVVNVSARGSAPPSPWGQKTPSPAMCTSGGRAATLSTPWTRPSSTAWSRRRRSYLGRSAQRVSQSRTSRL